MNQNTKQLKYMGRTEEAKSSAFNVLASPKSPTLRSCNSKQSHKNSSKFHPKYQLGLKKVVLPTKTDILILSEKDVGTLPRKV